MSVGSYFLLNLTKVTDTLHDDQFTCLRLILTMVTVFCVKYVAKETFDDLNISFFTRKV
jgi:hypothetical protein